ncbi:hypothetical protein MMC07_003543 [Pseudocyphellaria aurata]|nr:hypothetical protein [Pseudocyphellaria aurata]
MSLSSLPNELLRDIVSNFGSQDLCNLAACSRHLNWVMTPILYRDITISEEVDKNDFALDKEGWPLRGPLHKLACLLLARPDLAAHVKVLTFSYVEIRSERISDDRSEDAEDSENDEESEDDVLPEEWREPGKFNRHGVHEDFHDDHKDYLNSEIKNPLGTAVRALGLSPDEEREWLFPLSDVWETRHELELALLLSALLNLEKLVLDLKSSLDVQFLEKMMRKFSHRDTPFKSQAPLQALKVFVHTQSRSNARNADLINSLLRFPDIHEIFGVFRSSRFENNGASSIGNQSLAEIASSSSSICHIDMASYNADIKDIFRAPKALKTLSFTDFSLGYLSLQELRGALAPQEDHLERLIVGYDPQWENYFLHLFPKDR